MKKRFFFFFLLLSACSVQTAEGIPPILVPTGMNTDNPQESPLSRSYTPTRGLATGTMTYPPATFTEDAGTIAVPPNITQTPSPPIDMDLDPWIAFMKVYNLFLVDSRGAVLPIYDFADENIWVDNLYIKFSPDGEYLALVGESIEMQPVLEVMDLSERSMIYRETFSGSFISDFSWSPNSDCIAVSLVVRRSASDFDGQLWITDPFEEKASRLFVQRSQAAVVKVEWILNDQAVFLDFSCKGSETQTDEYNGDTTVGRSGIGRINMKTGDEYRRKMELSISGTGIHMAVSPDKKQILYIRSEEYGLYPSIMELVQSSSLTTLPCLFCSDYQAAYWFGNYLLAVTSETNNLVLLDTRVKGKGRILLTYKDPPPIIRVLETDGKAILIEPFDHLGYTPSIGAFDLDPCLERLEEGANLDGCRKVVWDVEGRNPDSIDLRRLPSLDCCLPGEWCYFEEG